MRIRLAVPDDLHEDDKEASINAALESVARGNEGLIASGRVPTFSRALQVRGIKWKPEPPGDEHFDLATTVYRRGHGDCDDLAPYHAASLRVTGRDPLAYPFVYRSGPDRYHAVVRRGDGSIDDPSKAAGMGSVGSDGAAAPLWASMFDDRLALATYPLRGGQWAARVDVPSVTMPMVYSQLAQGGAPSSAVVGALRGARIVCAEDCSEMSAARIAGLHDLLLGVPPDQVEEALEGHGCVGFLPALAPAAMSLAAPLASKALSMFGGGGGGGGAGGGAPAPASMGPGTALHCPGGPIIVRF